MEPRRHIIESIQPTLFVLNILRPVLYLENTSATTYKVVKVSVGLRPVMNRNETKNATAPEFTCDSQFNVLNMTLVSFDCFVVLQDNIDPCEKACRLKDSKPPNFDQLLTLNITRLKGACSGAFCNLVVDINFNFALHQWQSNNKQLDNLTWHSFEYPRLNDLLVLCNFIPVWFGSESTPNYCTRSSTLLEYNRTDFLNWQFADIEAHSWFRNHGFYFCQRDSLDYLNLKRGTFDDARVECDEKIMTPNMCDDPSLVDLLLQLLNDAQHRNEIDSVVSRPFMWTGMRRYNETHFRQDDKWIDDLTCQGVPGSVLGNEHNFIF